MANFEEVQKRVGIGYELLTKVIHRLGRNLWTKFVSQKNEHHKCFYTGVCSLWIRTCVTIENSG